MKISYIIWNEKTQNWVEIRSDEITKYKKLTRDSITNGWKVKYNLTRIVDKKDMEAYCQVYTEYLPVGHKADKYGWGWGEEEY